MATGFEAFERDLRVATQGLSPEEINKAVAAFAKQELHSVIAEGKAPETFDRYVNAVHGAPEESYRAPGSILYVFSNWSLVINAVLEELQKRSPRKSGRFASSFIVISGGRVITNYRDIPADGEAIITNAQPYARKAEAGKLGVPRRRLFDGTKSALARRFTGVFRFETQFLSIKSGLHPLIPYLLKHSQGNRKDRQAGMPITYPSIVIGAL
ncbi:hypothetical protein QBK99_11010 [Corticibacterium sp. UT-5YL-CI-8]|nr:hypothetical protein [Tianweitania sp. UT-5YL-CI-8]